MKRLNVACWYVLMIAFALIGVVKTGNYMSSEPRGFYGVDAALDQILKRHLVVDDGVVVLRSELSTVPLTDDILVVGNQADWTLCEVYAMTSYLAWPRRVWLLSLNPRRDSAPFEFPPPGGTKPSMMIFYDTSPPPAPDQRKIGDRLMVTRIKS